MADAESVADAKKQFYKIYNRELKQQKRRERRVFTVSFPVIQIQHIRKRSREYNTDIPGYIKALVRAEILNTTVIEQLHVYRQILQVLHQYKKAIDAITSKDTKRWFAKNNTDSLHEILKTLEEEIKKLIHT